MDCQLEICGRRKILVQRVCHKSNRRASHIAHSLRPDTLDSTLWTYGTSPGIYNIQASSAEGPAIDLPQCHTVLRYDINSDLYGYRHAVRAISSLPILCLYRLDDTVPGMESWSPSNLNVRSLGGPRMGVERVSEYRHKLNRGSRMLVRSGIFRVAGHEDGACRSYVSRKYCG